MNYSEKLKDPRWQKMRLEVFQRDEFSCVCCGNDKLTLHVHHTKYKGDPWQALMEWLYTVCEFCHEELHAGRPFKIKADPIDEPIIERKQIIVTESQLIDIEFVNNTTGIPMAVKNHYTAIIKWQKKNPSDREFLDNARNALSEYCLRYKIIFVCINGDVYGESETVVRHG